MKYVMRAVGIPLLILGLYLGALGPIAALEWNAIGLNSGCYDAAVVAYRPVDVVCEESTTARALRDAWIDCWTVNAPW